MESSAKTRLETKPGIDSLDRRKLRVFLERRRQAEGTGRGGPLRLEAILEQTLGRARELVPAAAGALLLDNPITRQKDRRENDLVVLASFGSGHPAPPYPPGRSVPVYGNVVGQVYLSGTPYRGNQNEAGEPVSFIAVPVTIAGSVCGVLLMSNRLGGRAFGGQDETLLAIFADYMSSLIVNLLDAERARELSIRDGLTGLHNDRYFHAQLSKEIVVAEDTGEDLSLVFFDLDNFKQVNDTHGHLAGSMVLNEVGGIVKGAASLPGATLTRYGGDEFVLVFPRTGAEASHALCERIRATIEGYCFLRIEGPYGPPLRIENLITCSLGVASYHEHVRKRFSIEQNKDILLKLADGAMYRAKELGKNRTIVAEPEGEEENEGGERFNCT